MNNDTKFISDIKVNDQLCEKIIIHTDKYDELYYPCRVIKITKQYIYVVDSNAQYPTVRKYSINGQKCLPIANIGLISNYILMK